MGRRGSLDELIGMVGAAKDDAAAAAAAAAVAALAAVASPRTIDESIQASVNSKERLASHRLRQFMRVKELRATDQEQDPQDYDGTGGRRHLSTQS